eukprot:Nk52_evm16s167 gene=Nk52_evmTU16s167
MEGMDELRFAESSSANENTALIADTIKNGGYDKDRSFATQAHSSSEGGRGGVASGHAEGLRGSGGDVNQGGEEVSMYSSYAGYSICVNYIIGTGVFAVPFAFASGGVALTTLSIVLSAIASFSCAVYVIEAMARAEGVISWWEVRGDSVGPVSAVSALAVHSSQQRNEERFYKQVNNELINDANEYEIDSPREIRRRIEDRSNREVLFVKPQNRISLRKFDLTSMCNIFIGSHAKYACQVTMFLYCYGVLWAFVSVFSSSCATLFFEYILGSKCDIYDPNESASCRNSYYIFVAIYAAVVIPLSLIDLGEQKSIQVCLTLYRFSAFIVMVGTCLYGIFYNFQHGVPTEHPLLDRPADPIVHSEEDGGMHIGIFVMSGFAVAFSSTVVALNFHYNLPDVLQPVEVKGSNLKTLVYAAMVTAAGIYILVGAVCAYFFGDKTEPLSTLNWKTYTACGNGWQPCPRNTASILVQLWILIFPPLDMLSVYSLVTITCGNNLINLIPKAQRQKYSLRTMKVATRLITSIPPIILGAAIGNLKKIFEITGLFAFCLMILIPCALEVYSKAYMIRFWGRGSEKTPFGSCVSKGYIVGLVFLYGLAGLAFCIIWESFPSFFDGLSGKNGDLSPTPFTPRFN